ncbi:MAG TPA: alpha/beta hydrolase [bacterium]|nr:alpha/beta hydrolase [bacterium]
MALTGCATRTGDPIPRHESIVLDSAALDEERRINIYTPDAYHEDRAAHFPVLYMPDGGLHEDFPHIVATIESLIADGSIPPMLVIGIPNTERCRDLTGPTTVSQDRTIAPVVGGSAAFRKFIRDELIPCIERRFRCSGKRAIVGESLAGLFVIETMLREPKLFDRYIAISPSLWWDDHALVRRAAHHLQASRGHDLRLYLTSANEEDIAPFAADLARAITDAALPSVTMLFEPMPGEEHHTIFRASKSRAFRSTLVW